MHKFLKIVLVALITVSSSAATAEEGRRVGKREILGAVTNKEYLKECGACHLAYQPQFLPKRSWKKIMNSLDSHFGDNATLDEQTKTEILNYVIHNSAESSSSKISRKMLATLDTVDIPLRISETPYFRRKHHELRPEVFKRKSVGSPANCSACHLTAEKGDYDEHKVKIPKQ
jgi:nitrate/TMAO reductase-like tetraheme cytochrome c subunit